MMQKLYGIKAYYIRMHLFIESIRKSRVVLKINIPKDIEGKIHKTFDLSSLSLDINIIEILVQVYK